MIAEVRADYEDNVPFRLLYVSNIGAGAAYNVTVSGTIPDERNASSTIPVLAANEARYAFGLSYPAQEYARNVSVRYADVSGNEYITEYRSIDEGQLFPIFREEDERT